MSVLGRSHSLTARLTLTKRWLKPLAQPRLVTNQPRPCELRCDLSTPALATYQSYAPGRTPETQTITGRTVDVLAINTTTASARDATFLHRSYGGRFHGLDGRRRRGPRLRRGHLLLRGGRGAAPRVVAEAIAQGSGGGGRGAQRVGAGKGVIENKHPTDVSRPPPPPHPRVCMSAHPEV